MDLEALVFNIFLVKSLVLVLIIWFIIFFYQNVKHRKYVASQLEDINRRLDLAFTEIEKNSRSK